MHRIVQFVIIALLILIIIPSYSQNTAWLQGRWYGKAFFAGSDVTQYYDLALTIINIKGNKFEGIITTYQPSDTSIRFDSRISGIIYDKYLVIKRGQVLYVKDPPGIKWKVSCNNCQPPRMTFSIEKEKFVIRGDQEDCYKECNGISEFVKDINEFDSANREVIYALAGEQKPPVITAVNKITDSSSTESTFTRITLLPPGNIVLTRHAAAFTTPQKVTATLYKNAYAVEQNTAFVKRILLPPSTEVVLQNRKSIQPDLSQKAFVYLFKHPSIVVEETTPPLPKMVLPDAILASVNRNTNWLLPKTSQHILPRKTGLLIREIAFVKRIPVIPAGAIVLTTHKPVMIISQQVRNLKKTIPYLKLPDAAIARTKVFVTSDTVSLTAKNNMQQKLPVTLQRDSTSLLPAGYTERKQNVVRTLLVNTDSVTLRIYDNGVIDGDIVSVIYNDKVVIDKLSLTARALEIKIPVNINGINSLVFHAHNLGEFPPNTAKLEILYGNKREELTVSSDLTVSSTIDIVHE